MGRKKLIADLFCGAGGSTTGAIMALLKLGYSLDEIVVFCLNHWQVAIDTHGINHPQARHFCQDLGTAQPFLIVPDGYLDLMLASPTCTHHSVARGGKPTSDQQRADPWHLIPWFTQLRVKRAMIENVWEFTGWGPVDPATGKPDKDRKGEYFAAWKDTILKLGATSIEYRKLNAANYGTRQTRQRMIMKIRFDKVEIGWASVTHAKRDSEAVARGDLQPWRPARECIDWSIKGRSIFTRKKPLALKTLKRIYAGIVKFGWPQAFIVVLRNHMAAQGIDVPLPALTAGGTHLGLVQPVILNRHGDGYSETRVHSLNEPLPTTNCDGGGYLVEPFVLAPGSTGAPRAVGEPSPTVTTGGAGSDDPGCARLMLVEPLLLSRHGEGAPRAVDEPTPTQVAKHSHCLIAPYYGSGSGETCNSANDPLPTATAKARFGMVVPITHSDGSNRARDVADPLPTLTTANRGELAFVTAQFGERAGQAPRVHDLTEPAPAICATGHVNLVEGIEDVGYDILFRMLEPHELAAAMGFNRGEARYRFAGNKTEQIKQIGNAVPTEMVEAEVKAFFADEIDAAPEFLEAAQ